MDLHRTEFWVNGANSQHARIKILGNLLENARPAVVRRDYFHDQFWGDRHEAFLGFFLGPTGVRAKRRIHSSHRIRLTNGDKSALCPPGAANIMCLKVCLEQKCDVENNLAVRRSGGRHIHNLASYEFLWAARGGKRRKLFSS